MRNSQRWRSSQPSTRPPFAPRSKTRSPTPAPARREGRAGVRRHAEHVRSARIEKAIAYSKSVYEVATNANAELSKVAERRVAEWNENFVSLLDKVSKNAPAGSDVAVAAVKSMLAAANSAYDNLTKAAKQATEIAEANVSAATETVRGFAKAKKAA